MSVLDLAGRNYGSLDRLPLAGIDSLKPYDFTLDVSENNLTSLDCLDSSPNANVLSQVEILIAQQNDLRDLLNVQFVFPNLVVLDVSENALETIVADDQACLAELTSLDTFIAASNTMLNFVISTSWPSLKVIDLSSNDLRDIPAFGKHCPNLVTVILNDNAIDSIQNLASRLPPFIEHLYLNDNAIDDWHRLAQLTAFAETLTTINVSGNEFCNRVKFSWKIFLAWLLPCAVEIDGSAITEHEKDAVNDLFRDSMSPTGEFSVKLLGTMEEGKELELEAYLNVHCRVTVRPNHPRRISPTPSRHSYTDPLLNVSSSSVSRAASRARNSPQRRRLVSEERTAVVPAEERNRGRRNSLESREAGEEQGARPSVSGAREVASRPAHQATSSSSGTAAQSSAAAQGSSSSGGAAVAQAIQQLQTKVKVIQDVVKVLRQSDIARRSRAAIVIQKYYRGYCVRSRVLTQGERRRLRDLHLATIVGFRRGRDSADEGGADKAARKSTFSQQNEQGLEKIEALSSQLEQVKKQLAVLSTDMALVSHIAHLARERAARKIQTFYRGYVARRDFRVLKGAYKKFTEQYKGPAIKIQSVVRMFLQRKRYLRQLEKHLEHEALRSDNKMLKARVTAMEKAMAAILSRLETVEQLALLGAEADGLGRYDAGEEDEDDERYVKHSTSSHPNPKKARVHGSESEGEASHQLKQKGDVRGFAAGRGEGSDRHGDGANRGDTGVSRGPRRRVDVELEDTPPKIYNRRHHSPSP